jgi:hypothetical protein
MIPQILFLRVLSRKSIGNEEREKRERKEKDEDTRAYEDIDNFDFSKNRSLGTRNHS